MRTVEYFDRNKNERIRSAVLFEICGFPRNETILRSVGIFPILQIKPSYNWLEQKLVSDGTLTFDEGKQKYIETFSVVELSDAEKRVMQEIKQEQNAREAEEEAARRAEEERLPDLEDAVAELGEYVDESATETGDAVIDLADYVATLEERIAALEGAKE